MRQSEEKSSRRIGTMVEDKIMTEYLLYMHQKESERRQDYDWTLEEGWWIQNWIFNLFKASDNNKTMVGEKVSIF